MKDITEPFVVIFGMVVTVALLSVILSTKSNTAGVLQSMFSGLGNILGVATAPVTGANVQINTAYPSSGFGGFNMQSGIATPFGQ